MNITFYEAPLSSATPVGWALAELAVPHERVRFDLKADRHKQPEFLKLNPNGKVPTLVVDGTPMFEALAIMMWLGERFGVEKKLWPALDSSQRGPAMAWSVWSYISYGSQIGRYFLATTKQLGEQYQNAAQADYTLKEVKSLLDIVDARLAKQPYMLEQSFTLVDLIAASVIGYGAMSGLTPAQQPHVKDWLDRCMARPAARAAWSP